MVSVNKHITAHSCDSVGTHKPYEQLYKINLANRKTFINYLMNSLIPIAEKDRNQ